MKHRAAIAVMALVLAAASPLEAQRVQPKDPEDAPEQYPPHANRDDAFFACVACHSFKIVAQQGMSRDRWDESLNWMTERHKMPKLEGKDREKVLDYLETVFPERKAPGGWKNPFAP
jgi:cytochrome c553